MNPITDEIFYIGKGKDNRCFSHLNDKKENEKTLRIQNIRSLGFNPKIEILAFGLSEDVALRVEAAAIDLIGVKNLSNLQRGHKSDDVGRKTLEDLVALFENKEVDKFHENIVLVRINKSYKSGMPASELYEYTRGIWKIGESTRNSVQYACSVYAGIIREIYKIEKWFPAGSTFYAHRKDITSRVESGRFEFVGNIAPDLIRKRYNYKSVANYLKAGNISPLIFVGPNFHKDKI